MYMKLWKYLFCNWRKPKIISSIFLQEIKHIKLPTYIMCFKFKSPALIQFNINTVPKFVISIIDFFKSITILFFDLTIYWWKTKLCRHHNIIHALFIFEKQSSLNWLFGQIIHITGIYCWEGDKKHILLLLSLCLFRNYYGWALFSRFYSYLC